MTSQPTRVGHAHDEGRLEAALGEAAVGIEAEPHVLHVQPVVMAAWTRATTAQAARGGAGAAGAGTSRGLRRWLHVRGGRRAPALIRPMLAGALALLLAAGSAAASTTPGAPLYATRLGIERALLPSPGSANRAAAELAYADRRLAEAREASERGDQPAVLAALDAFTDGLRDVAGDTSGRAPDLRQHIELDAAALAELRSKSDSWATLGAIAEAEREVAILAGRMRHPRPRVEPGSSVSPRASRRP